MKFKNAYLASTALSVLALSIAAAPSVSAQTPPAQNTVNVVKPLWGDISAFDGGANPLWGDISAFEGGVNPFWGDISAFWGDISAFEGDISAFWGDISAFDGSVAPLWGDISAFWGDISAFENDPDVYLALQQKLGDLVDRSEAFWGEAVQAQTGKSFREGFAADLFAKHGIDLNDASSFEGVSDLQRTRFFLDWHDALMDFSGRDQVDHWMRTANWTPSLTKIQGSGADTVIGLIDFTITEDADLRDNLIHFSGSDDPAGGHGGAVASLLVADHDGHGLMGIAPKARVAAFNPFDHTGTASWNDIARGVVEVRQAGASVVNMSLGVPGSTLHTDWLQVYSRPEVLAARENTVYVHAAGNDGLAQSTNINWNFDVDPHMIIVGSVGPAGNISPFSNTPGNACLLKDGKCGKDGKLMDRFIVAPGEWILVTDGHGGVTRASGASFAAPIVTGAIALLHDRWSWLNAYPKETVDIILSTATDLGAPGVDAVYGRGLINITASQSPLDFAKLYQRTADDKGKIEKRDLISMNKKDAITLLGASDGYVTVFEDVGETYRDFLIPLDELLAGIGTSQTGQTERLQTFVRDGFTSWSRSMGGVGVKRSKEDDKKGKHLTTSAALANPFGWDLHAAVTPLSFSEKQPDNALPYASRFTLISQSDVQLNLGNAMGVQALTGNYEASSARFDPVLGGVNPALGLASGGAYASLDMPAFGSARFSIGATQREYEAKYADPFSGEIKMLNQGIVPYRASAATLTLTQPLGERFSVSSGYTYLKEADGVLGVQATNPDAFAEGAKTDAVNIGMDWALSDRFKLTGNATMGRTRGQSAREQNFAVNSGGITTSAFEAAMHVDGVFGKSDHARIAVVQPMHVERGGLDLTSVEVTDRSTGAFGPVTRFATIDDRARMLAVEAFYSTLVLEEHGQVAGFVRSEMQGESGAGEQPVHMVGAQFTLEF